ncbi:diguanylate cyclase [Conexibacter stalactiti]|uniref:Diguanylate cyclase n=1 Tax=Conexibacter stalactiti TaxID=1940611 RepID=A0ABU4HNH6_9ACTN|nr:diguanylate cyclase [Conexibacter stalactiti]MDW5594822.1 diguanylate cyclase [Conexibacter stalactiti]MEC5035464.1 diguanylate cyclase [Conexibacter stalactiti]
MSFRRILPTLLFGGLLAGWIIALVLVFGAVKRDTDQQFERSEASQQLLAAMLDQEIGVRGFLSTFEDPYLEPYTDARHRFDALIQQELELADSDEARDALRRLDVAQDKWEALAADDVRSLTIDDRRFDAELRTREGPIDAFRAEHARYQELLDQQSDKRADQLLTRALVMIVMISLLLGGIALLLLRRGATKERRYNADQAEFAAAMQAAGDEAEADALLKRHLERQLEGSEVTVLRRSAGNERLESGTAIAAGSPLQAGLRDARPRDCLAIRRGAPHVQREHEPLVACEVCGRAGPSACRPLVVGDGIIGAVNVQDDSGRAARGERVVTDSLAQAAPILSGLRTLALAQSRATTDALTGLPNRWAFQDALKRMLAQAGRSRRPLALVVLDIDHFKQLNDTHGHDAGDRALVAVGEALRGGLRDSDLAARSGGEEFAVLLPDTPIEGAMRVAEELRRAIAAIELDLDETRLTASFGVAVLGIHALEAHTLMQAADRALYAAKRAGRDRVEVAEAATPGPPHPLGEPDLSAT